MVTVTGGKWTTYRLMAEHAVDAAIRAADKVLLEQERRTVKESMASRAGKCRTTDVAVVGAHGYSPDLHVRLLASKSSKSAKSSKPAAPELEDAAVMSHLAKSYGDRAPAIVELARSDRAGSPVGSPVRISRSSPRRFCTRRGECCQTTCDFVARRTRRVPGRGGGARSRAEVNKLLAKELGWGSRRAARSFKDANALLDTFTC